MIENARSVAMLALLVSVSAVAAPIPAAVQRNAERISFETPGGVTIAAEFVDAGQHSPGVLLFPMCSHIYMDGWQPVADRLHALGVSSLSVTYRGWGGSTGAQPSTDVPIDAARYWTETWGPDADAGLTYLRKRLGPEEPIATGGASCGMHMALTTAIRHPSVVKAVVAVAGPSTQEHLSFVAGRPDLPILAVAAEGDRLWVGSVQAVRSASNHPRSDLILVPGSSHGTLLFPSRQALVHQVADWLSRQLHQA
jgi:alpha-beta hydrolase superfamily lysophospholipase